MALLEPSLIQQHYAKHASNYDQFAVLQGVVRDELIARLDIINIDINHILDMGSGTGQSTKELLKLFKPAEVNLLDLSVDMLNVAKKNKPWFSKVRCFNENANSTSLDDDCIDLLISNLMLQQCSDPDAIFKEAQRITRENGLVSLSTLGPDSFKELRQAGIEADIGFHEFAFGHLTDMHDIGDALLRNGLREPVLDVDTLKLSFSTFSDLWNELQATGCVLQSLSVQELDKLALAYPRDNENLDYKVSIEIVYAQAWAGDGKSKARSPDEFLIPVSEIKRRS